VRASLQGMPADKLTDLTNSVTPYDVILFGTDKPATRAALKQTTVSLSEGLLAAAEVDETARRASLERIGLYAEGLAASNNWVISGKRTADGKPILANDPHLAPTAPNLWYLVHLTSPTVRVSGVTLPGVPGVVLGHNEHIAWGATNVGPDVQDLYLEILNPQLEYKTPTGWSKMTIREETINVRQNLLDPSTKPEQLNVRETRNGVIIHEEPGKRYALKWTARDPKNTEFEAFFALNRARNWDEFKKALRTYGGASQNFVYADVKGNIAWHVGGRIPVRRAGDGALPYDGSTGEGDWTGFIPFEELPNLYNPASGLIVTANQRIVGTSYKYTQMSRDAAAPWRARRIQDLLEKKTKVTIDEVRDVQHDAYSIPHHKLSEEIRKTGSALPETLAVLDKWDGRMLADSRAALLSHEIRDCLANTIAEANKPVPASVIRERVLDGAISGQIARWLPPSYVSYKDLLIGCDQNVRTSLTARFGSDEATWTWGRTWRSRFPHPMAQAPLIGMQFATPSVPIDGSGVTPNVGSAVSMRHIASPGNWDATRLIIPLGQSGDPNSTHFKDQFELWRTGTPAIFPFTPDAVKKATVASLTLTPKR
jgi:penicillin G amidase